ncbi:hypothetical protein [Mycoplasmopsis sturni]|uniref:hypothetical protein n=1 Tax=Mycoplasmopsis sturni TaxID=39047 RepID=UPI000568F86E|nr:hypothetical protein [Mycoplasmopsis sturni]
MKIRNKFKLLTLLSVAAPTLAVVSAACSKEDKKESEQEIKSSASVEASVKQTVSEGEIKEKAEEQPTEENQNTEQSKSLNLIKEQLEKLSLYSHLYDKKAYEDYFDKLAKNQSEFTDKSYAEDQFTKDLEKYKAFYLKIADLNQWMQEKSEEEVIAEIDKHKSEDGSIFTTLDGELSLTDLSIKEFENKLASSYSNIIQEKFDAEHPNKEENSNGDSSKDQTSEENSNQDSSQNVDETNGQTDVQQPEEDSNTTAGERNKNQWLKKFNDLLAKVNKAKEKAVDSWKGVFDYTIKSIQSQIKNIQSNDSKLFENPEYRKNELQSSYNNLENQAKSYASGAGLDWDNLDAKTEFEKLIEKLQSNIDDLSKKVESVLNSQVAKVVNQDIEGLKEAKKEWETRVKNGESQGQLAGYLKSYLDEKGAYYNTYHSSLNEISKYNKEREERAKTIAENTKTFNDLITPETFSWMNREVNMQAFDSIVGTLEFSGFGDYFLKSESNLAYSDIYNDEVKNVIEKYIEKFSKELKEGRGELDNPSTVEIDPSDLEIFKKLVKIADNYTKFQIDRYNKIREKLHVPALENITSQLTEDQRANLVLQGILGYTRGLFIKDKTQRNDGKTLSIGHGLNKATQDTLAKINKAYTDNYYGSYNNPVYTSEKTGLTNDFLSTLFFRLILGERKAYDQDLSSRGDKFTVDGWGHLAGTMDNHVYGFYGVPIAISLGIGTSVNDSRTQWRLSISDMLILPKDGSLQHATEKEGEASAAAEKAEEK